MTTKSNFRTEVEARKLWCPMSRYRPAHDTDGTSEPASFNRYGKLQRNPNHRSPDRLINEDDTNPDCCRCIASQCMMWQWFTASEGCCGLVSKLGS
jgi:hypothetical protein